MTSVRISEQLLGFGDVWVELVKPSDSIFSHFKQDKRMIYG